MFYQHSDRFSQKAASLIVSLVLSVPSLALAAQLEEVIVVAQKKAESLQDAPISIVAFNADALEKLGIDSIGDIGPQVPNVQVMSQPISNSTLRIFIRGVGITDVQITQDGPIGVYMNGVYIARSTGMALDVVDLQSMEVLRGPQGTLYGRNSVGGALNLTTIPPNLDAVEFSQKLSGGNFGHLQSRTMLNVPVLDNVAIKASYLASQYDGYLENKGPGHDFYESKAEAGRIDLRWQPTDNLVVDYAYDYSRFESAVPNFQATLPPAEFDTLFGVGGTVSIPAEQLIDYYPSEERQDALATFLPLEASDDRIDGHALNIQWDLPSVTVKSITAYRELGAKQYADLAASPTTDYRLINGHPTNLIAPGIAPANISNYFGGQQYFSVYDARRIIDQDQFSQEFQFLGSVGEKIEYVAGLYYFEEKGVEVLPTTWAALARIAENSSTYLGALQYQEITAENVSKAAFTQLKYFPDVLDGRLNLTLGLRYTEDTREANIIRLRDSVSSAQITDAGQIVVAIDPSSGETMLDAGEKDFDNFSYAFTVAYDLSDAVNTYVKYSTAYKSGGFNTRALVRDAWPGAFSDGFDEENVASTEIGLKGEFFDRRLRSNLAVFYTEYEDVQRNDQLMAGEEPGLENVQIGDTDVYNGGNAEITGMELDITTLLTDSLILTLNYGYLDAEYTSVKDRLGNEIESQREFYGAPRESYRMAFDYDIARLDVATVTFNVTYSYTGERPLNGETVEEILLTKLDDFSLLNARLAIAGIALKGGELNFAFWGKNLMDEEYVVDAIGLPHTQRAVAFGEPRTYGLDMVFRF